MAQTGYRPWRTMVPVALFTLAAGAATYGTYQLLGWHFGLPVATVLLFLFLLTALLLIRQEGNLSADPRRFTSGFMAGLAIKLLAGAAAVAAILSLLPRDAAVRLTLTFAVLYLAFLAFSTMRLGAVLRNLPRP